MHQMKGLRFLLCVLAALSSTDAGYFRSSGYTGVICQNGGTSVTSLTRGEHMFCVCPEGFEGDNCETDISDACLNGMGLLYRGTRAQSQSGRRCLDWDLETRRQHLSSDVKSGRHNYCRNIEFRVRPWCYVWGKSGPFQEYCDIPHCNVRPGPGVALEDPSPTSPPSPEPEIDPTCGQRNNRLMKIVGGTIATVESHPWVAAIFWRSKSRQRVFRCGGTLISPCWVLTAAHCFPDGATTKARRLSVVLGKSALNETEPASEQAFRVEQLFVHEGYDNSEGSYSNDIALLKLRMSQGQCANETKSVRMACVPPPGQELQSGIQCEVAGYGKEHKGLWYNSQYLRQAKVLLLSQEVCQGEDYYGGQITGNMFCAARPDWSQDACEGDSGGPLVCEVANKMYLFGIVSWGEGCAREFRPGVYTRVTNYNRWIANKTGLSSFAAGSAVSTVPLK